MRRKDRLVDRYVADHHRSTMVMINRLISLGILVVLGILVSGTIIIINARRDAWAQAIEASDNITAAIAEDIERTVSSYDLSISGAIKALQIPGLRDASLELQHAAIFDTSSQAKYLGSILVLDKAGDISISSTSLTPPKANFADRDYFQSLKDHPQDDLYVSRPFKSRLRNGDPSIAFVRAINDAEGHFNGVVQGTIRLAYFQDMFAKLSLGQDASMSLIRTDGRLLARQPMKDEYLDRDLSLNRFFKNTLTRPFGHFPNFSVTDKIERIFTFRHVGNLPLIVTNGISIKAVLAAWWQKAISIGLLLAVLSVMTISLCVLFRREMMRRLRAEDELLASMKNLGVMANTDPLTGLSNRRAFDSAFAKAWRQAIRSQLPIALIMLDADHFKLYNDRYGHQKGDNALRLIGSCINKSIRRSPDLGARYGGEEFIVVLPEANGADARIIAERIRKGVEGLNIEHKDTVAGRLTVSVGVAWALPCLGEAEDTLITRSDLALYESKRAGRNCTTVCRTLHLPSVA